MEILVPNKDLKPNKDGKQKIGIIQSGPYKGGRVGYYDKKKN